jgi:urease accessory protein
MAGRASIAMNEMPDSGAGLYRLMAWLSPAFPVGAYAYSHGIEWAVEAGAVGDRDTLGGYVAAILRDGAGRSDAILFAHAFRAAKAGDAPGLRAVAELAAALPASAERHLETRQQGAAFIAAISAAWPAPSLALFQSVADLPASYPVAVAIAAAAHGVALEPALACYLQAFAANLVSAGVRLVPLGQSDGQRIVARLETDVASVSAAARNAPLDAVGGAAFLGDIAAMRHETQHTRLFRS